MKNYNTIYNRPFALLLAVIMLFGMFPAVASAEEDQAKVFTSGPLGLGIMQPESSSEPAEEPAEGAEENKELSEGIEENEEPVEGAEENTESEEVDPELLAAYEAYLAMTEEEQAEYLASLTEEELTAFTAFVEAQEAKEAVETDEYKEEPEYSVQVYFENLGNNLGEFYAEVTGNSNPKEIIYQWQISYDGETWEDIPGATDAIYTVTFTRANASAYWHVVVDIVEETAPEELQEDTAEEPSEGRAFEDASLPAE